jgi:hypothetical protein
MPHTEAPHSGFGAGSRFARLAPWAALLLAVVALWIWADRLLPRTDTSGLVILSPPECDLDAGDCIARLPAGDSVRVRLGPGPAAALRPLQLELAFSAQDPAWVEVDLAGLEMFMGHLRPRLERVGPGTYRGEVVLPACTGEAMTWAATVLPEGVPERAEFQFRFVSRR